MELSHQPINVIIDGEIFKHVNKYKISEHMTEYFSLKEIVKVYNATFKCSTELYTMINFNNKEIYIKMDDNVIIFDKKNKLISSPIISINNDIYIPIEVILLPEFAEITESNINWNPLTLTLNITHDVNISAVRYFTKSQNVQIIVQLEDTLPYTISESQEFFVLKILGGKIQEDFINVNNGTVKNIQCFPNKNFALIKINFEHVNKIIKTSMISSPYGILIDIFMPCSNSTLFKEYQNLQANDKVEDIIGNNNNCINYDNGKMCENIENIKTEDFTTNNIDKSIKKNSMCQKIIVLDAGHGGDDPGAIGPNGTKEKDINLKIIHDLKSIFDNNNDYKVILTRDDDIFIPLAERTNIANKYNADLFISVHCNATINRDAGGFEIYYLSENATDHEAEATAILENSVLKLESRLKKRVVPLEKLLSSMIINEYINESSELSGFILAETMNRVKIQKRGVKQASFFVLKGARMPAVLVESAFLSNYSEEAKLGLKKFRAAVADSIYEGVVKYYANKSKEEKND
jgi:N-acetylmuramoyl-L-alanine amidase